MSGDYIETGLEGDLFTIAFSTFVFWYITKTLGQRRNDWYPNYLLRVMKTGKHLTRKSNVNIFMTARKKIDCVPKQSNIKKRSNFRIYISFLAGNYEA